MLGQHSTKRRSGGGGFLTRLRRDRRANVLPLMAAAMIPMFAMVGSAVDISRAYLVKTRLQQACDAGALAARRVMTGSSLTDSDREIGQNFFASNLRNGDYGATGVTLVLSDVVDANGIGTTKVRGEAKAEVPTTIMKVFNHDAIEMAANCEAELNISNNDIMFVLDVTGSMSCRPSDSRSVCSSGTVVDGRATERTDSSGANVSRMEALRNAVISFYDTVSKATATNARLRIGFVPYSSGVNVGRLLQDVGAMRSGTYAYQSRERGLQTSVSRLSDETKTNLTDPQCDSYGNASPLVTDDGTVKTTIEYGLKSWTPKNRNNPLGTCVRTRTRTVETWVWKHRKINHDISAFLTSPAGVQDPTKFEETTSVWDGCIEERLSGANDIATRPDPTRPDTHWAPAWGSVSYARPNDSEQAYDNQQSYNQRRYLNEHNYACPKAAMRLSEVTKDQIANYVSGSQGFAALGYTYHDIGMVWAARLMAKNGLFQADHDLQPDNGRPVLRHIIFMTDGFLQTDPSAYTPFGIESLDKRISKDSSLSGSSRDAKHTSRFSAACAAARSDNISIWVVGFATELDSDLTNCADSGQAFTANTAAELNQRFQYIAARIADLRLSK